jgi:hypothetical protein
MIQRAGNEQSIAGYIGVRDSAAVCVCVRPRNAIHFQAALAAESRTVI